MNLKGVDPRWMLYGVGLVAAGYIVYRAAKLAGLAGDALAAAGQAANQNVALGVGAIGSTVGLPTPAETVDDPAQVRYIADKSGWFVASKWATATALFRAASIPAGQGTPPPANSPAGLALAPGWAADDETARLLYRYPRRDESPAEGTEQLANPMTWGF